MLIVNFMQGCPEAAAGCQVLGLAESVQRPLTVHVQLTGNMRLESPQIAWFTLMLPLPDTPYCARFKHVCVPRNVLG